MSVVVGVADSKSVWIGADSALTDPEGFGIQAGEPKVVRKGEWLLGWAGDPRTGQLVRHAFHPPIQGPNASLGWYLTTQFVESLASCLDEHDVDTASDMWAFQLLLGYRGNVFTMRSDFQIHRAVDNYAAIGNGQSYALGSLCETADLSTKDRVTHALLAAVQHDVYCRRPCHLLHPKSTKAECIK